MKFLDCGVACCKMNKLGKITCPTSTKYFLKFETNFGNFDSGPVVWHVFFKGRLPWDHLKTLSEAVILHNWTARSYTRQASVKYQIISSMSTFWSIATKLSLNRSFISFCEPVQWLMAQTLALHFHFRHCQVCASKHVIQSDCLFFAIFNSALELTALFWRPAMATFTEIVSRRKGHFRK